VGKGIGKFTYLPAGAELLGAVCENHFEGRDCKLLEAGFGTAGIKNSWKRILARQCPLYALEGGPETLSCATGAIAIEEQALRLPKSFFYKALMRLELIAQVSSIPTKFASFFFAIARHLELACGIVRII